MWRMAGCLVLTLITLMSDHFQAMREKMVEFQIEMRGVKDPVVLRRHAESAETSFPARLTKGFCLR